MAAAVGACCALAVPARAAALPQHLRPAAPFPRVIACDLDRERIAPGIERAAYRVLTAAGPLRVELVIADPANPSVRFDTVPAHDAIGGPLEPVSSMALRTGAVAGINGDYYASGANGAPVGAVVRNGVVLHAGSERPAFAVGRDGRVHVGPIAADAIAAIGGGPVLLRGGTVPNDAGSTNEADRAMRIPASVLVRFPAGEIGLVAVDGRRPAASIGVNRDELIGLLRSLGAADALLLDSGGSTTLVARKLGDRNASVINAPSDGAERAVADGFFVYSDAPTGPASALVVRPAHVTILAGATVRLSSHVVDAAGHGLDDAQGPWRARDDDVVRIDTGGVLRAGARAGRRIIRVERDGVAADVTVRVVPAVARVTIGPPGVNPSPHQLVALTVDARDAAGASVEVADRVRWSARDARIDERGRLIAGDRDAVVTVQVGPTIAAMRIPVGWHAVPFPIAVVGVHGAWAFVTAPSGGRGALGAVDDGVRIGYDFSRGGRAAYARAQPPVIAGTLLALACDVVGDGNGEALRLAFSDRYGARESITLAPAIDFTGVRRMSAGGLAGLAPPLALRDVYVVGTLATPAVRTSGTVGVERCTATLAGSKSSSRS